MNLRDLKHIDAQSEAVDLNTLQFISGYAANNTLLTGARGTGNSSLIKGLLNKYASRGLRLIEVDKADLFDLPEIVDRIYALPNKFILFCDDLSFGEAEHGYTSLKAVLDGSASAAENVLVYATSNRRHLMPEVLRENMELQRIDDEIHPGETVEEKLSLSERFGLWVSFHPFNREQYLAIVDHWLKSHRVVIANKSPGAPKRVAVGGHTWFL